MGIPRLIGTLEPYGTYQTLKDTNIVIDGPSLAYHVLHICRMNGVSQPSYRLLSKVVLAWLDELRAQAAVLRVIYFDGRLPLDKRPVRMERLIKNAVQLTSLFKNGSNCFASWQTVEPTSIDLFKLGRVESGKALTPPFLVPSIIETLCQNEQYADLVRVVPGEADTFCAHAVASHGGTILTSDSDLLAHDLVGGQVCFFKDIHRDGLGTVQCLAIAPDRVCERLGITGDSAPCRLAFEQKCSPQSTISVLVKACSRPPANSDEYESFRGQYSHQHVRLWESLLANRSLSISGLDPRLSELTMQFLPEAKFSEPKAACKMFLPVLIDSPERGTAWEPSTPIRQVAYTLMRTCIMNQASSVQEYRRVQNPEQKGREVLLLTEEDVTLKIADMLSTADQVRRRVGRDGTGFWMLLCALLNIAECSLQGKPSHVQRVIQQQNDAALPKAKLASWDDIHFTAHMQAGLYSFRMLYQVLKLKPQITEGIIGTQYQQLNTLLEMLPGLQEYPDMHMNHFPLRLYDADIVTMLAKTSENDDSIQNNRSKDRPELTGVHLRKKVKVERRNQRKHGSKATKLTRENKFSLLSYDE